jgi:hypothetical protein
MPEIWHVLRKQPLLSSCMYESQGWGEDTTRGSVACQSWSEVVNHEDAGKSAS